MILRRSPEIRRHAGSGCTGVAFPRGDGTLSGRNRAIEFPIEADLGEGMRVTTGGWTVWAACALISAAAHASDLPLVNDSGSAVIVLPDQADAVTRGAAELLRRHVEASTASSLRILSERDAPGGPSICLGRSRAVNLLAGARLDRLSADGFLIKTEGERLILAGRTALGDRNAVLEFLRRYCAAEWYMPGGLWESVRRQQALAIPAVDLLVEPAFTSRARIGLAGGVSAGLNAQWALAQGAAARHDSMSGVAELFPPERYAKQPEYFALVSGRRAVPAPGSTRGWQLCMASPAVIDEYTRLAEKRLGRPGEAISVSATPNPGGVFCECPACHALWDEAAAPERRRTRLTLHFVNEVARRLARFRPGCFVALRAEDAWAVPLDGASVEPNVIVFVNGCNGAGDADDLNALRDRIRRWRAAGARRLGLHERLRGDELAAPQLRIAGIAAEIGTARAEGVEAWSSEDYPSWGLQGPQDWIISRLLWEPELDAAQLTERFCADLFAPASASMLNYFRQCERHSARDSVHTAETLRSLRAILSQAERECYGVEPAYTRVRFFSTALAWCERMAAWSAGGDDALRSARAGDFRAALAALGTLGGDEDDPLLYMKVALDPLAGAHYCKSESLGPGLRARLGSAVRARGLMAETTLNAAASTSPASGDMERSLDAAFAARFPDALNAPARRALADVRKLAARYVCAPMADAAPVVDGDLGDAAWSAAQDESGFVSSGGILPARCRTTFRLIWRGDRLYAAFNCLQPMDAPRGVSVARDGQARSDDAVELVLARAGAAPEEKPLRVVVTVKGVAQIENAVDGASEIRVASRERVDRWCTEIAVPLRAVGIDPVRTRAARLNVARYVRGRGALPEESAWFPIFADESAVPPKAWLFLRDRTQPMN